MRHEIAPVLHGHVQRDDLGMYASTLTLSHTANKVATISTGASLPTFHRAS